jgi:long-chain acyl-CoA synthetase
MSYSSKENLLEDMQLEKPTYMATVPMMWQIIYYKVRQKLLRQPKLMKNLTLGLVDSGIRYKKAQNHLNRRYPDSSALSLGKQLSFLEEELANYIPYKLADRLVFHKLREMTGGNLKAAIFGAYRGFLRRRRDSCA